MNYEQSAHVVLKYYTHTRTRTSFVAFYVVHLGKNKYLYLFFVLFVRGSPAVSLSGNFPLLLRQKKP